MANKEFTGELRWAGGDTLPVRVVAFNEAVPDGSGRFVSVNLGRQSFGEFKALATPEAIRAFADLLYDAADFADPPRASAAALSAADGDAA